MSMIVKNNMSAVRTLNTLNQNSSALQKSLAKVSSGQKINSAKDDASSYVISEKMREQIRSLEQDDRNVQNAGSLLKTAEGAVNSTVEILRTIKEKAVNAATDTNTDKDRAVIQKEIDQFIDQIDDNALITFNGKRLLDGSTVETTLLDPNSSSSTLDDDARAAIIKGLSSEWVQAALNLVDESFGIGFDATNGANAGVKEITVHLDEEDSSALAWVTNYSYTGSKAVKLELHVNMKYYDDIDMTNENGATTSSSGAMYLDRTLAHEFTHAAMAANITDFNQLPKWFKEGSAELSHGADDARAVTMLSLLQNPTTLQAVLNETNDDGDNVYAAGFMILRYMAKEGAAQTGNSQLNVIKNLMSTLSNTSGNSSDFDAAINSATGGKFTSKANLISQFMSEVNNAAANGYDLSDQSYTAVSPPDSITWSTTGVFAFLKDKFGIDTKYYSNINDPDTGSITGSDAGGSTSKNKYDIVPENTTPDKWRLPTSESTTYSGLKVIWPDGYYTDITSDGRAYTYSATPWITEKKIHIQVGTKANQATAVGFHDMRAKSLGTLDLVDISGNILNPEDKARYDSLDYDTDKQAEWLETLELAQNKTLKDISVVTQKDANTAIRIIDGAIEYALDEATNIGAYLQRFDYTGRNITTMGENVQSAESTIRDADMAKEMTEYTKNNVLLQAAQSMLAQANQNSSAVLSLLQ